MVRYDLRGYGLSEPVAADFTHLRDLLGLLDHLEVPRPVVAIGCSMCGTVAMDYALARPEEVRALVMVGSGPSGLELDVLQLPQFAGVERAFTAGDLDLACELETQIWFDGVGRTPAQVDRTMRQLAYEMNRLVLSHESHRTGLGDVAACQGGGRVLRSAPGIHGLIERRFDMPEPLYAVSFGPIHTPAVLGSAVHMDHVSSAFPKTIPETREDFFFLSRQFAEESGLITHEVRNVIQLCDSKGVLSSMTMLGNGVFAYGRRARDVLLPFGRVYEFHVSASGARVLEDLS